MLFRAFAIPDGPFHELALTPRLESWERQHDPAQIALREFVAHVRELVDPVIAATPGKLAFRLDVGLADQIDPMWERDLDNYLFPIARNLPNRVVSVWGTKGRCETSRVRIAPAVEVRAPAGLRKFEVGPSPGAPAPWKAAVRAEAARAGELPSGPVALELSIAVGPQRNWLNMWKPSIDALEPLLGRTYEHRHWNPLDGRIVRLGLHRQINAGLGHDAAMAAWGRPADESWPEMRWLAEMTEDERTAYFREHLTKSLRAKPVGPALPQNPSPRRPRSARSGAESIAMPGVTMFRDDDDGYLRWLEANPDGFVVNIQRSLNPSDARLHFAYCGWIKGENPHRGPWTGAYVKLCTSRIEAIDVVDAWAVNRRGSPIRRCGTCKPPAPTHTASGENA